MTNAIATFRTLVVTSRDGYGDFETTPAGEPYHDDLWEFCVGDSGLEIPDLGIDFTLLGSRKENVDLCESKLRYDLVVEFRDESSGKSHVLSTAVYKATDRSYGNMDITELVPKPKKSKKAAKPVNTLPKERAQALVDKIGSFFEPVWRELVVDEESEPEFFDLMCSPSVGDTLTVDEYQFKVTDTDEQVTNESDGWSLGSGFIELTEVHQGFKVTIGTDLFLGQSSEICGVYINCGAARCERQATRN